MTAAINAEGTLRYELVVRDPDLLLAEAGAVLAALGLGTEYAWPRRREGDLGGACADALFCVLRPAGVLVALPGFWCEKMVIVVSPKANSTAGPADLHLVVDIGLRVRIVDPLAVGEAVSSLRDTGEYAGASISEEGDAAAAHVVYTLLARRSQILNGIPGIHLEEVSGTFGSGGIV